MEIRPEAEALRLSDYAAVLRRRKWIVIEAALVIPIAALLFSRQQQRLYQASAEVLISQPVSAQVGAIQQDSLLASAGYMQTQAELARSPKVSRLAVEKVAGVRPEALLSASSVSPNGSTSFLVFEVRNTSANVATRLVNAYASAFTQYRSKGGIERLQQAAVQVDARIGEFQRQGVTPTSPRYPQYASLLDTQQKLESAIALQTQTAEFTKPAENAAEVQPKTRRNVTVGALLGLLLGALLAFAWEALDNRVRSDNDVEEQLDVPLLARLPAPPRELRKHDLPVMIARPNSPEAEPFHRLQASLEFTRLDRDFRTLMVTSPEPREGKSTTVANLAVAAARAGRRVVAVDLDLRHPLLHQLFRLDTRPGLTEVALGYATLDEALVPIPIMDLRRPAPSSMNGNGNGNGTIRGILEVLPAGTLPPNPGEFVGSRAVGDILRQLRDRADLVLVDAPPLLAVGDATILGATVDAIVAIVRLNAIQKKMLREFARLLKACPAEKVGYVLTGADLTETHGYGVYSYYRRAAEGDERELVR